MIPFAPFSFFTDRKLYIHNAGHAVLGYLGYLAGYEYGYEALADDEIYFQARGAMEESALALTRKYHPAPGALLANIEDLLHRFGNRALGDTILRLGRDPIRKLAHADRLVGAAAQRAGARRDAGAPGHRHRGRAALRSPGRSRGAGSPGAAGRTGPRARPGRRLRPGAGRAAVRDGG